MTIIERFKREKDVQSSATIQSISAILILTAFAALSLAIADDQSNRSLTANSTNSYIAPRYAIIDLGTNNFPVSMNNLGDVILTNTVFSSLYWHNGSITNVNSTSAPFNFNYNYFTATPNAGAPTGYSYATNTVNLNFSSAFTTVTDINDNGEIVGTQSQYIQLGTSYGSPVYPWPTHGYSINLPTYWTNAAASPSILPMSTGTMTFPCDNSNNLGYFYFTPRQISNEHSVYGVDNSSAYGLAYEGTWPTITTPFSSGNALSGLTDGINRNGDIITQVYSPGTAGYTAVINYSTGATTTVYPVGVKTFDFTDTSPYVILQITATSYEAFDGTNGISASLGAVSINSPTNAANLQIIGNGSSGPFLVEKNITTLSPTTTSTNWISNPLLISNLISTGSSWTINSVAKINNNGAIVGTATYTPQGTNDTTPAGPHGVMLLPMDLVVATTNTTTPYQHIDAPPLFPNDDGVGRGPSANQSNPSPKGVFITLLSELTTSTAGSMTAVVAGSGGSFNGTLTETNPNSGIFVDANNLVTLTLPIGSITSNATVDTLKANVNSTSLGINNLTISLVESGSDSLFFYSPISYAEITFSNPYNSSIINTANVTLQLLYMDSQLGDGIISPGPYTLSLSETSAGSGVFTDPVSGLTISWTNFTGTAAGAINSMVASFSNGGIGSTPLVITLRDTTTSPLQFTSYNSIGDSGSNYQSTNIFPDKPSTSGDGVFYVRVKGVSSLAGVTVQTDIGTPQPLSFTPLTNDVTTLISQPILIVPQSSPGPTSYPSITTLQTGVVAPTGSAEDTSKPFFQINQGPTDLPHFLAIFPKPHVNMFIGQGAFNSPSDAEALKGVGYVPDATINMEYASAMSNPADVQKVADVNLNLLGCEVLASTLNYSQFIQVIRKFYIMYVVSHGVTGINNNNIATATPFQGISFSEKPRITIYPEMISNVNGAHKYTLVFLNACNSADANMSVVSNDKLGNPLPGGPYKNEVSDMAQAFNCMSYVGWQGVVSDLKSDAAGIVFFRNLTTKTSTSPGKTVLQAINATMSDASLQGYLKLDGTPDTAKLSAPQGPTVTADQISTAP